MDKSIKFSDRTTVYATGRTKHHKKGDKISVHPVQADALVASGKATREAPEGEEEADDTDQAEPKTKRTAAKK